VSPLVTIKDTARESLLFRGRIAVAVVLVAGVSLLVLSRLSHLQVYEHEHFATLSEDNRVKVVPVIPTRGLIFDRNGVVLAENVPTFSLELIPEAVGDLDTVVAQLGELIELTQDDHQRFKRALSSSRRFQHVPLRLRLTEEEVSRFAVNRHRFPGVDVEARLTRYYPLGSLTAHIIGYVGRINEKELRRLDTAEYRGSTHVGKTGVEHEYEKVLHGKVGYQHVEINAQGRILRVLERIDPVPGDNLTLHLDVGLQQQASVALGVEHGSIVAVDPLTGGVLAMISKPGFDANLFVDGINAKSYRALLQSPGRPLFNRALNGQYPPGSTVKPFLALASLELGMDKAIQKTSCPGWFRLPGKDHRYRDWKKSGHGHVSLKDAITQSCDVFFYELALEMGVDRMHEFMKQFGFGERTGIDLPSESSGLNPSRSWKRNAKNQPWYPGETLITGIGQGFSLATPLQLAHATATLSMRGLRLTPRVVMQRQRRSDPSVDSLEDEPIATRIAPRNDANWESVVDAMESVVHGRRGTARKIATDVTYRIAGKTGTAQVFSIGQDEEYDAEGIAKKLRDHGLFIAFAPVKRPRIVVSVLVENGGGGSSSAAPRARMVMDYFMQSDADLPATERILMSTAPAAPASH
jgi:penicillin-binding protein 2